MKRLLLLVLMLTSLRAIAQSVDRNDIIISVSPGATLNYYESADTTGPFHTGSGYWGMRAPVSAEYAFNRTVGISADFVYTRLNAGTMQQSNYTVLDFGLGMRFHTPSAKRRIDWFGEVGFHYSKLHYFYHGDWTRETTNARGWCLYSDVGVKCPFVRKPEIRNGTELKRISLQIPESELRQRFRRIIRLRDERSRISTGH